MGSSGQALPVGRGRSSKKSRRCWCGRSMLSGRPGQSRARRRAVLGRRAALAARRGGVGIQRRPARPAARDERPAAAALATCRDAARRGLSVPRAPAPARRARQPRTMLLGHRGFVDSRAWCAHHRLADGAARAHLLSPPEPGTSSRRAFRHATSRAWSKPGASSSLPVASSRRSSANAWYWSATRPVTGTRATARSKSWRAAPEVPRAPGCSASEPAPAELRACARSRRCSTPSSSRRYRRPPSSRCSC